MTLSFQKDYDPKYCEQIVEFTSNGASLVEFAAKIGISRARLDAWKKQHYDFNEACDAATAKSQAYYEFLIRLAMVGRGPIDPKTEKEMQIKHPILMYILSRRYNDYREKSVLEHTGKDGGPIQNLDLSKLSDEDLLRLEHIAATLEQKDLTVGVEPAKT